MLCVQEVQKLMVEFADFPTMLVRMLNAAIREPHATLAVFIMQPSGEARLDFIQVSMHAFVCMRSTHAQRRLCHMQQLVHFLLQVAVY